MGTIADLLQATGSSLPLLLVATIITLIGYVGRGVVDAAAVAGNRQRAAQLAAAEAAAEAAAAVRVANISDQAAFRAELLDRVGALEGKLDAAAHDCSSRLEQKEADHAAALGRQQADYAEDRAKEAARHSEALSALRGEHAQCLEDVAALRQDLGTWREQAEHFADVAGEAMKILRTPARLNQEDG